MESKRIEGVNAIVFGLAGDLSQELLTLLDSICNVRCVTSGALNGMPADVIFCGPDVSLIQKLKTAAPEAPIVVVTRHPEVSGWLDSIEAGAADYCAAPFEQFQVRWILESTMRSSHF